VSGRTDDTRGPGQALTSRRKEEAKARGFVRAENCQSMYANVSSTSFGADRVTTGVSCRFREPVFHVAKELSVRATRACLLCGRYRETKRTQSAAVDRPDLRTLTHDTSRTGERHRKQVDNGRSRGAKGTIDVSRYAAAPRRDRDSRSKWAIPRYGYGGIKRSPVVPERAARAGRVVVKLNAGERAPLRPKKLPL